MRAQNIAASLVAALLMGTCLPDSSAFAQSARVTPYTIENASEISKSLTGRKGDSERGRKLYFNRERTGCSGCHGSPGGPGAEANAEDARAPNLTSVAARMGEGVLRLWIVAPEVLRPGTEMPAYYAAGQRDDPNDPRFGETRLSAAQVEDIVAYLLRQSGP
ncbi:MAG: c-type cytochrome [Paracoccaceae bacterium]